MSAGVTVTTLKHCFSHHSEEHTIKNQNGYHHEIQQYIGHIMRKRKLENIETMGKIEGKRAGVGKE